MQYEKVTEMKKILQIKTRTVFPLIGRVELIEGSQPFVRVRLWPPPKPAAPMQLRAPTATKPFKYYKMQKTNSAVAAAAANPLWSGR
jgi:hypothetical protein